MIGVLTTSYPRSHDDCAGTFVQERVRALLRQGHEVEVLAAGEPSDQVSAQPLVTRLGGQGLFYRGGAPEALEDSALLPRLLAWCEGLAFSSALLAAATRLGRRWQAVESHWLLPCGLVACLAVPHLPHRAHLHGADVYLLARLPWAAAFGRAFCRRRPHVVFASSSLRHRFSTLVGGLPEAFGAQSEVEPAPFDRNLFRRRSGDERARLRDELGMHERVVLGVGRLVRIKGYDVLLAAVGRMASESRPRIIILGEGPERAALGAKAHALGVRLELPGPVPPSLVADYMAAADLFVHPCRTLSDGRSEGMPLAVREALASGLPVIASASGGLCELGGASAAVSLVPADDAEALAGALSRFLQKGLS